MLYGIFDHSASELVIFESQVRVKRKVTIENLLFPNDLIIEERKQRESFSAGATFDDRTGVEDVIVVFE